MILQFILRIARLFGWAPAAPSATPEKGPAPPPPPPPKPSVTYVATGPVVEISAKPLIAPHEILKAIEGCWGTLGEDARENIGYIVDAMHAANMWRVEHVAYTLATVYHETKATWEPVAEAYWLDDPEGYRRKLRYYPYYGRGYSQLTWLDNYIYMSEVTGYDLVKDPDMAMVPIVAAEVLVHGMLYGFYPGGPTLHWYLNELKTDFYNARRVVNVLDKAQLIAGYADCIYEELKKTV